MAYAHERITFSAPVVLGATRLSILDLSPAAHQPFVSEDGRYVLVHNGEVYNYQELRKELERGGAEFRSSGDTEVVLKAYQAWGESCVSRFEGMFAFAILDTVRRRLFLARDPFGIKPLYYSEEGGFFFASQLGSLLSLSGVSRRIDDARLARYLESGWSDGTDSATLLASVRRFPAACFGIVDLNRRPLTLQTERYWSLPKECGTDLSIDQAAKQLRDLFILSMERHLRSDVPVASALSGGVDSSSIVATARMILGPTADIHTFTFTGSGHREIDEEPWARIVSKECGTVMHKVDYAPEELAGNFDRFVFLQDWPTSSPVVFAQQQVFKAARAAGFKVMLSGQGPDEYLAGYPYHVQLRASAELRVGHFGKAARLLIRATNRYPLTRRSMARSVVKGRLSELKRQWRSRGENPAEPENEMNAFRSTVHATITDRPLPGVLRIEDSNSMSCSVESRLPLLTTSLVDFVLSLPDSYLVSADGVSKAVFRKAMRGITPDAILDRKDKLGFPVPLDDWLRAMQPFCTSWIEEAAGLPCMEGDAVRKVWQSFLSGGNLKQGSPDAFRLWRWIFLAAWVRRFNVRFS
jgi:asparagine synthase (glutamine-hydrolysing)